MRSFRYRTATLLGPWRESAEAAVQDAIRAKQARRDEEGGGWHWVVPGAIEEGQGAPLIVSGKRDSNPSPRRRQSA